MEKGRAGSGWVEHHHHQQHHHQLAQFRSLPLSPSLWAREGKEALGAWRDPVGPGWGSSLPSSGVFFVTRVSMEGDVLLELG